MHPKIYSYLINTMVLIVSIFFSIDEYHGTYCSSISILIVLLPITMSNSYLLFINKYNPWVALPPQFTSAYYNSELPPKAASIDTMSIHALFRLWPETLINS